MLKKTARLVERDIPNRHHPYHHHHRHHHIHHHHHPHLLVVRGEGGDGAPAGVQQEAPLQHPARPRGRVLHVRRQE